MSEETVRYVNFYPPCDTEGRHPWRTTSWNTEALAEAHKHPGRLTDKPVRVVFNQAGQPTPDTTLLQELVEALEFYADPFNRLDPDSPVDFLGVPDFYSEMDFGARATEALTRIKAATKVTDAAAIRARPSQEEGK